MKYSSSIWLIVLLFSFQGILTAQWTNEFSSAAISSTVISGFLNFEKSGDKWKNRFYQLDSLKFTVSSSEYSTGAQYTYNFTPEERLAGGLIYSLSQDLTGDNITEFYVMAYYGPSPNYRQSFKIIDITNSSTVIEFNNNAFTFTYPTLWDVDNDGIIECVVIKYDYPAAANYFYEVYSTGISTSVNEKRGDLRFSLDQNFPNPANPSTQINYTIPNSSSVRLEIFNITGELIKTLVNMEQSAGSYKVRWDGYDHSGVRAASGVYFYRLNVDGNFQSKKMILLK